MIGVGHQPNAMGNLQQREERERRALADSILQAGEAREMDAESVAGHSLM